MKYAAAFTLFSAALVYWAAHLRGWGWLLLWPAVAFALAALAYGGLGPRIFSKRSNGRLPPWSALLMAPFIALNILIWHTQRLLSRERAWDEVAPGLYVGRRPFAHELPPNVHRIVDLTAEFSEPRTVRQLPGYRCFPILDATAPHQNALDDLLHELTADPQPHASGGILIHCAQGHGRSGMLAAALLLRKGLAQTPQEAERLIQASRPGVKLSGRQRQWLTQFTQSPAGPLTPPPPG